MPKYSSDDIKTIKALDHIRANPWMYVRKPKDPLPNILSFFAEGLVYLGVDNFSINNGQNSFLIKAKTDWFNEKDVTLEESFHGLHAYDNCRWAHRGEVFLTAFYFPYYTSGQAGNYGDKNILDKISPELSDKLMPNEGRILLISKGQILPNNHGIVFEQPQQSLAELENQKAWLDIAISHYKNDNSKK